MGSSADGSGAASCGRAAGHLGCRLFERRTDRSGADTYVLFETNVSSVFAIPDEAAVIARVAAGRLKGNKGGRGLRFTYRGSSPSPRVSDPRSPQFGEDGPREDSRGSGSQGRPQLSGSSPKTFGIFAQRLGPRESLQEACWRRERTWERTFSGQRRSGPHRSEPPDTCIIVPAGLLASHGSSARRRVSPDASTYTKAKSSACRGGSTARISGWYLTALMLRRAIDKRVLGGGRVLTTMRDTREWRQRCRLVPKDAHLLVIIQIR